MLLFILDSLGNSEMLLILLVALIFLGPRKLPQISRQIAKGLAEFRRASEDFKRTWEREVALEETQKEDEERSILPPEDFGVPETVGRSQPVQAAISENGSHAGVESNERAPMIAEVAAPAAPAGQPVEVEPAGKSDWL
jgi:Tat protein translocase TatB subunit